MYMHMNVEMLNFNFYGGAYKEKIDTIINSNAAMIQNVRESLHSARI